MSPAVALQAKRPSSQDLPTPVRLQEVQLTVSMDFPLPSGTQLVLAPTWAFLNITTKHAIPTTVPPSLGFVTLHGLWHFAGD